jgi:predicted transcriptional regulator
MNHAAQHLGVANVSPKSILDMNYAFAQTALLMAAVRLHLFTYLASDPLPATTLAKLAKTEPESMTRLLEGLRILGLVEQKSDIYQLTPLTDRFLVGPSPVIVALKGEKGL